jgi:hypothetical protein
MVFIPTSKEAKALLQLRDCGSMINLLALLGPLVVNVPYCRSLIFLTASLVNLQQVLIECGAAQLTITFHKIVDVVVFSNAFIRPSNATVGLLLLTDAQECVFRNL